MRALMKEIWENLPVWFLLVEGIALLNTTLANIPDSAFAQVGIGRGWFALLQLPATLWFCLYYRKRFSKAIPPEDRTRMKRVVLFAAIGVPSIIAALYLGVPSARLIVPPPVLRSLYEISAILWTALLSAFALRREKRGAFAAFFLIGLLYGFILENSGIIFGFFEEKGFNFYPGPLPAPLATTVGWCFILFASVWTAERLIGPGPWLKRPILKLALLATAIAVSVDLQIDPLASLPGVFWRWNELLPPFWFGVPFCNYAAWFGAIFVFALFYFAEDRRPGMSPRRRNLRLLALVPAMAVLAGLLWLLVMLGFEAVRGPDVFASPTATILGRFLKAL